MGIIHKTIKRLFKPKRPLTPEEKQAIEQVVIIDRITRGE